MFKKADKKQIKLKLALAGPSGSGKTYSGLEIAKGIARPRVNGQGGIAVIDTENGSASLYADIFDFDVIELHAPYTTEKYLQAMNAAFQQRYDVLIVDSISHQWAGDGGILNRKEQLDSRGGNSYTNWGKMTPEHEKFKAAILALDMHMICTMRSKQDYILQENDKGKMAPKKVGLAPVQREGLEYEFTLVLDLAMDHSAHASKDRTSLFDKEIFVPNQQTGVQLKKWLDGGIQVWKITEDHKTELRSMRDSFPGGKEAVKKWVLENCPIDAMSEEQFLDFRSFLKQESSRDEDPNAFANFR